MNSLQTSDHESFSTSLAILAGDSTSSVNPHLSSSVLLSALEDPMRGLVLFDGQFRILHATERVWSLLEIATDRDDDCSDLLQLLFRSSLDVQSCSLVKARLESLLTKHECSDDVVLSHRKVSRRLRIRLRELSKDRFAASVEDLLPENTAAKNANDSTNRDPLTNLATRVFLESALQEALSRTPLVPLSVLLLDLDRFKAVNDTLGHAAGDTLLRLVSERLKSAVRKSDTVARFGGDEFAILVDPSPSSNEPIVIAQRILDLVQRTYLIDGQLVNVGVSIGIAQAPADGMEGKTLLRNADLALYQAKASGRAMFQFFDVSMEERAVQRRMNELELRKALALRQLEVHYQPQVDTPKNRLVGFEALLRWRHPERGLIAPGLFLPLAEEIGVIVPIGDWVLRTACKEAMKWPDHVTIAVNASPLQFDAGDYADSVRRALASTGLPGERLEIEVTEGILLQNTDAVLQTLHDLRAMKVRIAMDDFGTGYASLSQLARFPFDKIKIDRSLAGFEGDDLKQRAIVRAITALGNSLGVCTLAEGVENAEQVLRLQNDGCASVQGYLFGRPVPASELADVIARLCPELHTELHPTPGKEE